MSRKALDRVLLYEVYSGKGYLLLATTDRREALNIMELDDRMIARTWLAATGFEL